MSYAQRQRAERNAEILRLVKLGRLSTAQIARQTRVSPAVVARVCREAGIASGKPMPLTTEQLARAECLFADGVSRNEVARTLGCSRAQLSRAFPGQAWTVDEKVEFEHITGLRKHTETLRQVSVNVPGDAERGAGRG